MRQDIIQSRGYDPNTAGSELSLKIASYPATARYLTKRLSPHGATICELCCGVGISLVELSTSFDKIIGVDNDPDVIRDCRKNLAHAGVQNYELLCGDVADPDLLGKITADVVLYDIPYWSTHQGQVDPDKQNPDLKKLVANIRTCITENIVIYAPTHMTYPEVQALCGPCEFAEIYISGKHDRNFVFLGATMKQAGKVRIEL
jgi:ribosomal protein L11 methylase PrmA